MGISKYLWAKFCYGCSKRRCYLYMYVYIFIYIEYSTGKPKLFILITKLKFSTRHTTKKFSRFYPEKFRTPCGSSKTERNGNGRGARELEGGE